MSTQFTWIIEQMQCIAEQDGHSDVVVTANWRCNGVLENTYGTIYGTCEFTYTGTSFIPYNELTQDEVLGWCWNNGVDKEATQLGVDKLIQNQIAPAIITLPNPWGITPT